MIHPIRSILARTKNRRKMKALYEDFLIFKKMSEESDNRFKICWENRLPILHEKSATTSYDHHYVLHTAWAARVLAQIKPKKHVDISSSLYFSAITSAFIPIDFYDFRPAQIDLSNLTSNRGNLMALPFRDNTVPSISCMHTIEHVGLGRYGDPLDPHGDLKAIEELKRVTAIGGNILFVTPIGKSKLMFNGHRIYSYAQIMSYFPNFKLVQFALIPDNEPQEKTIVINATEDMANRQNYGCGCFWFVKQ